MIFDKEQYKKVINIPLSIIIGSFIIIIITTGMTDQNGLKALIGGYSGLLMGMLFILILNCCSRNFTSISTDSFRVSLLFET